MASRCLVPRFDGAILSKEWTEALWDKFVTEATRSSQQGATGSSPLARARRQSSSTAIASFARAAEPGTGHQPQDGGKVAQARDGRGYEDRADGTKLDGFDWVRGGDGCRVPAPHAPAAGRLCLCPAVVDPAPDTVSAA